MRVILPYQALLEFREYLAVEAKKKHRRFSIAKLDDEIEFIAIAKVGTLTILEKDIDDMLNFLMTLKLNGLEKIEKWANHGISVISPEYFNPSAFEEYEGYFFFGPETYFYDIKDALSIQIDYKAFPEIIIDASSLTPKAILEFKDFVNAIPFPKTKPLIIHESKHYSKRYVENLYPAVGAMWVDEMAHRNVSRDVIDLVNAAIDYLDKREWRMSIILSALAVETMLGDIYEDLSHKEAPAAPIGYLIQQINKISEFPSSAKKILRVVNRLRKAAVHRGTTTFTQKDAIATLRGSIQFILWSCFEGKSFCNLK